MPAIPGSRSRDNFDTAGKLAARPVKINFLALLQHAPKLRNELAGKLQQFHNEDVRPGNVAAPQIRPVPFSPAQAQAARTAPAGLPAQNGVAPMEHMWEAEEAYFADQPRTASAVVKATVQIMGHTFEGILDIVNRLSCFTPGHLSPEPLGSDGCKQLYLPHSWGYCGAPYGGHASIAHSHWQAEAED